MNGPVGRCGFTAYEVAGWREGVDPAAERCGATTRCGQVLRAESVWRAAEYALAHDCEPPEARALVADLRRPSQNEVRELLGLRSREPEVGYE